MSNAADDWSTSFIRLRTELFLTATVIFAVTTLDLNLNRLPLLGVDLSHPVPRVEMLCFLLPFYCYFLLSWCLKAYRERFGNAFSGESIKGYAAKLQNISEEFDKLNSPKPQAGLPNVVASWNARIEQFDTDFEGIRHGLASALNALGGARPSAFVMTPEQKQAAIPGIKKDIEERAVKSLDDLFHDLSAAGKNFLEEETISAIKKINKRTTSVETEIDAVQKLIQGSRLEVLSFQRAFTLDRWLFGFFIPLFYAVAVFAWAVFNWPPISETNATTDSPQRTISFSLQY